MCRLTQYLEQSDKGLEEIFQCLTTMDKPYKNGADAQERDRPSEQQVEEGWRAT